MNLIQRILFFFLVFCGLCSQSSYASFGKPINLSVSDAVELALKQSPTVRNIFIEEHFSELEFSIKEANFYMPEIALTGSVGKTDSIFTMDAWSSGVRTKKDDVTNQNKNVIQGAVGISISSKNLFNGFNDYDQRDIDRLAIQVTRIERKKTLRDFIFNVILTYYRTYVGREKLEISKKQLEFSKSVYELVKQKFKIKKATEDDKMYALNEYMEARRDYKTLRYDYQQLVFELNKILFNPVETTLNLTSKLTYTPMQIKIDDVLKQINNTPDIKSSKLNLKSSQIAQKISWKSRVPMPTLEIAGYSMGYGFSNDPDASNGKTAGFGGSSPNLDVTMSLNWTFPIWGSDGFLSSKAYRSAQKDLEIQKVAHKETEQNLINEIHGVFTELKKQEEEIKSYKESLITITSLLDITFLQFTKGKKSRTDLKDILGQVKDAKGQYLDALYSYVDAKSNLAKILGKNSINFSDKKIGKKK